MIFSGARRFGLSLAGARAGCWRWLRLPAVGVGLVCAGALLVGLAAAKRARAAEECTPAVMVVRHAEDEANPAGHGPDVLSALGKEHAALYPELFEKYLAKPEDIGPGGAEVKVCPIGKIIAIDPFPNSVNSGPSSNPYETIKPLVESLNAERLKLQEPKLEIQVKDPDGVPYSTVYNWNTARRMRLLQNGSSTPTSTVIAWDKQGLNPSADDLRDKSINGKKLSVYKAEGWVPLLKALPTDKHVIVGSGPYITPQRTNFWLFSLQDPVTGKFGFADTYEQWFSDDHGLNWYPGTMLSPEHKPNDIRLGKP
jgi:hypothetical protein